MRLKKGQYHYSLRGNVYQIYRCEEEYGEGRTVSRPVAGEPAYLDREKARARVYELNGWNGSRPGC